MEKLMSFPSHFCIQGRKVGNSAPCLIIAEAGVNHFGDMDKAFRLVDLAVDGGADVFKIQHFYTDRLIGETAPEWRERMRPKELSEPDVLRIKEYCDRRGIIFMCTPHDDRAFQYLHEQLNVPAFKIGSGEVENWPFLKKVAKTGKPVILSTGMYEIAQIREAVRLFAENNCSALAVLHCVTNYPAEPKSINLKEMNQIREFFTGPVGYSDHTAGTAVPLAAVALGASIIEKHITLDRDVPNAQDWKVSCDPSNFRTFVDQVREIEAALGGTPKFIGTDEKASVRWARKSLHAAADIHAGEVLLESSFVAQRPGTGISPARLGEFVGRRALVDIRVGTIIDPGMIG